MTTERRVFPSLCFAAAFFAIAARIFPNPLAAVVLREEASSSQGGGGTPPAPIMAG